MMHCGFVFVAIFLAHLKLGAADIEKKSQRRSVPTFIHEKPKCSARLSDSILCSPSKREYPPKELSALNKTKGKDEIDRINGKRLYITATMLRGIPSQNLDLPLNVHPECLKQDEKQLFLAMTKFFLAYQMGHETARDELLDCFYEIIRMQKYKSQMLSPQENWVFPEFPAALKIMASINPVPSKIMTDSRTNIGDYKISLGIGRHLKGTARSNLQVIQVADMDCSAGFYKNLLNVEPIYVSPHYVAFAADAQGEALFLLCYQTKASAIRSPNFIEIGIMIGSSSDVNKLFEEWRSLENLLVIREPYDDVFGRTFFVQDPDKHLIRVSARN